MTDYDNIPDEDVFEEGYESGDYLIRLSEEWTGYPVFDRPTVARVLGVPLSSVEDSKPTYGQYYVYINDYDLLDKLTKAKGHLKKLVGEGDRRYYLEIADDEEF